LLDLNTIVPLSPTGLSDYHCHCVYSVDATGSIDDYCKAALKRNLAELCFTTHYDVNPRSVDGLGMMSVEGEQRPADHDSLAMYVEDVRLAHERFYPLGLSVVLGLEYGWYKGCEEDVLRLREKFGFDYLLAGVHEIEDICYCCSHSYERCFERYPVEKMAEVYYREVIGAARSGLFNTIAHLDYYRKYGELYYGPSVHQAHRSYMTEVFKALRDSGTALEVNTAARRKGLNSFYPQTEVINAARRAGVDVIYLGSDAHAPEQVGADFEEACLLVPQEAGGCDD
jgi:histidinol-phosphatase (PHP family)